MMNWVSRTIAAVALSVLLVTGGVSTSWAQRGPNFYRPSPSTVYYVSQYGLVADGATDNTAAMATMLADIYTAGGGIIEFGKGTYRFDQRVVIPNNGTATGTTTRPKNVTMLFKGQGAGKVGHVGNEPLAATVFDMRSKPISFTDGVWTAASWNLASSSLASYTFYPGDLVQITTISGGNAGYFRITAKPTATSITIHDNAEAPVKGTNATAVEATIVQPAKIITRGDGLLGFEGIQFTNGGSDAWHYIHTTGTTLHVNQCSFYGNGVTPFFNNAEDCIILGAEASVNVTDGEWVQSTKTLTSNSLVNFHYIGSGASTFKVTTTGGGATIGTYTVTGKPTWNSITLATELKAGDGSGIVGYTTPAHYDTDLAPFQGYGTVIEGNWFQKIRRGVFGRTYCNGVQITNNTWWWNCGGLTDSAAIDLKAYFNDTVAGNYVAGNLIEMAWYSYGIRLSQGYMTTLVGNTFFDCQGPAAAAHRFEAGSFYNTVIPGYADESRTIVPAWAQGTAYKVGQMVKPTASENYHYQCTVAGTSHTSEPSWGVTVGGTTADGTVTWTCLSKTVPLISEQSSVAGRNTILDPQSTYSVFPTNVKLTGGLTIGGTNGYITGLNNTAMLQCKDSGGTLRQVLGWYNATLTLGDSTAAASNILKMQSTGTAMALSGHASSGTGVTIGTTVSSNGDTRCTNLRFGTTIYEGLELRVLEQTVNVGSAAGDFNLASDLPTNVMVLGGQINLEKAITGAGGAEGVGLGISGTPNKYGWTTTLTKNSKGNLLIAPTVTSSEDVRLWAVNAGGAATGTIAGSNSADVRIRLYYWAMSSLKDAP